MKLARTYFLLTALFLAGPFTQAAEPAPVADDIPMGPEFTFTHRSLISPGLGKFPGFPSLEEVTARTNSFLVRLRARYEVLCRTRKCRVVDRMIDQFGFRSMRFDLVFEDGWKLEVRDDPHVIEVKASPRGRVWIKANEARLQEILFDEMAKLGLRPNSLYGSGHLNLDLESAFLGNPKMLVNWLTDYFNHPALALGVFEIDPYNAPAFVTLTAAQKNAYQKIVADVFAGKISTIAEVSSSVSRLVFLEQTKYQSIRLHPDRLEIRAIRAQKRARDFTLLAELFQKRVELIRKITADGHELPVLKNVGVNSLNQAVSQFHFYVTDTGLEFAEYRREFLRGPLRIGNPSNDRTAAYRDSGTCGELFKEVVQKSDRLFRKYYGGDVRPLK
jgi:hypothetical protein